MITKEDVEKYMSIMEDVPDEIGEMKDGRYNSRYVGDWGQYVFLYFPKGFANELREELEDTKDRKKCKNLSYETHGDHRFICTLPVGHKGLCVAGTDDFNICAVFEPDEDADMEDYVASKMAHILAKAVMKHIEKKDD